MNRFFRSLAAAVALFAAAAPARAAFNLGDVVVSFDAATLATALSAPSWKCLRSNGTACGSTEMSNPWYRQIVILPTGFAEADRAAFFSEFEKTVALMTKDTAAGASWSVQKRDQLIFVAYFFPGGALGSPTATFGGKVAQHPVRGYALSLSNQAVYAAIDQLRGGALPHLRPFGVGVLFNDFQDDITANAAPPTFIDKPYGIAKWNRYDLRSGYIAAHELAHAALNFLDEYVEAGFQDLSIKQIDIATPLLLLNGTWGGFIAAISDLLGVYDYNASEILANNGGDNISTSSRPSTVATSGYAQEVYEYEGGMFFGRGTFHDRGNNLMNSDFVKRAWDDGFGYGHSAAQQRVIDTAFSGAIRRPNDRIRNAGPKNGWPSAFGSTTHVMLFDADKNHHFQPTRSYSVQVGWYERQWKTCWGWGWAPYPCYDNVWKTAQKTAAPSYRAVELKLTTAWGIAGLAQKIACQLGFNEVSSGGGTLRLCDQSLDTMANNFLPTLVFKVPYQNVPVPASQWFTTYWYRFSTNNGAIQSGWTGWSSFYRSL